MEIHDGEDQQCISVSVAFYPEMMTALLTANSEDIDLERLRAAAQRYGLNPKEEFHFTVIGRATGEAILNSLSKLSDQERQSVISSIQKLCEEFPWQVYLANDFYYIKKDYVEADKPKAEIETRQSIIQLAVIEGLEDFYTELTKITELTFEVPMPHITLFTTSTNEQKRLRGIGIYSEQQFRKLDPVGLNRTGN
ncbi:MAG: hypothetical protein ABIA11_03940 [Patescibacteria group bacterium]|nr:hypothetical protein [Patescibacteria group bacterium]